MQDVHDCFWLSLFAYVLTLGLIMLRYREDMTYDMIYDTCI